MSAFLYKLFVARFYKANAGFFLFFFFFFFGVVNAGSLISYHLSLMKSFMNSPVGLAVVMSFWTAYAFKCIGFIHSTIKQETGSFLFNFQLISPFRQFLFLLPVFTALFLPVLAYQAISTYMAFGWRFQKTGYTILLYSISMITVCTLWFKHFLNNWHIRFSGFPLVFNFRFPRLSLGYLFYFLVQKKKSLFLVLKGFSLLLLYIALVLNSSNFTNDGFVLFFILWLMVNATIPFLTVDFLERNSSIYRNLLSNRLLVAFLYLVTFALAILPEFLFLAYNGYYLVGMDRIAAYYCAGISTMYLLMAVQYSDQMDREEFIKVAFGIFFVSTFAFQQEAYWATVLTELLIGSLLFFTGWNRFDPVHK
jgi:hypothetical protein